MASRFRFSFLRWLQDLVWNPYFWGGLGGMVGVVLALFFLFDAVIMPSYTRHEASVRVPAVENQLYEEARAEMEDRGLDVRRQVGRYNPNVDRDIVVDQTPLPKTTVKPGRRVYLTVNAGDVPTVVMPDLSGLSVREARNRVSSLGLDIDTVQADSIPSPYANTITGQSPPPEDSIQRGAPVKLWYSTGLADTTVVVPNVVGRTVAAAQQELLRDKLRFIVVDTSGADAEDVPDETSRSTDQDQEETRYVQRQGHSAGAEVRAGTAIRLFTTTDSSAIPPPAEDSLDTTASENRPETPSQRGPTGRR